MKEKEKLIIYAAIKLFASKGVSATSIQEIVDECKISKGAFYLYFKSKEALLLAIFEYYHSTMQADVELVEKELLPPREKFIKQIAVRFERIQKTREFIIMTAKEQAIPFNKETGQFMRHMKEVEYQFIVRSLTDVYGEEIIPYHFDLNLLLHGISKMYVEVLVLEGVKVDFFQVATFILSRLDDLVEGLIRKKEVSIFSDLGIGMWCENDYDVLLKMLTKMKQNAVNDEHLHITLDTLEIEMKKETPRIPIIQGMLANLKSYPEHTAFQKQVADYYQVKLI